MTIVSDATIFLAYTAIPLTIAWYMHKRKDVLFPHILWLFIAFIFACGATHLLETIIFWYPIYPAQAVLKVFTAIVSVATVIATAKVMPHALAFPGLRTLNIQLQTEVKAHATAKKDLTERTVELMRSERRLLAAQQAARIGDWYYEPLSQKIYWSDQVYDLFKRDKKLGPPKNFEENLRLYTESGQATLAQAMAAIEGGESRVSCDLELQVPERGIVWHTSILNAEREPSGAITRLWGTVQDITENKLETLKKERQSQELLRINQQLEQFAYIASHDLIEPLRKVRFFRDIVAEETTGKLSAEGQDAMERMATASERMTRLIKDLLIFARSGKSLQEVSAVPLADVVREALESCDQLVKKAAATIEIGSLPIIEGDTTLLVQVFQNLLTNALRYRDPQRKALIRINSTSEQGRARIIISDNGLGFDADQAARLFEPFVRLHPKTPDGGTGIGLAICRRIIEAHGGQISATPRAEGGADFILNLPLHKEVSHGL
jgi:signal transduction histidine kinase